MTGVFRLADGVRLAALIPPDSLTVEVVCESPQGRRHGVDDPCMTYDRTLKRLYVFGARIHHGAVGLALTAIGCVLVFHDRADWPFRLRD